MRQEAATSFVVALDAGTTGVRALLVDGGGAPRAEVYREVLPACPAPGLVEHDPETLFRATLDVLSEALAAVPGGVRGLGIATQRGTAVVWEADSGRAVHPAISWQDGRTIRRCADLLTEGVFVSPLAAATKIEWILDRVDPDRDRIRAGRLRCGTLDAWLAWRLSGGRVSATDASNASCSGLFDLVGRGWNDAILAALRVPAAALPEIVDSEGVLGQVDASLGLPAIPIAAVIGDQQAAMMGQLRLAAGEVKITYGTSAMLDLNAGPEPLWSMQGAYPLVLWQRAGHVAFCLEGTAITAGAAITWLRDGLGVIRTPAESGTLAASVTDAGGVWAIPAFQGLGTPYMDAAARAVVGGLSRATTRAARRHRLALPRGVRRAPHRLPVRAARGATGRRGSGAQRAAAPAPGRRARPARRAARRPAGRGARRWLPGGSRDRRVGDHRRAARRLAARASLRAGRRSRRAGDALRGVAAPRRRRARAVTVFPSPRRIE